MANSYVNLLPKQTAQIILNIPWSEIEKSYDTVLDKITQTAEIAGFRKGKAPKKIVEQKVDKTKLYEEVIKDVVPKVYTDTLKQHNLTPVLSPKIELTSAKQNQDWVVTATVALKPIVTLKDYKTNIKKVKEGKAKIWVPGQSANVEKEKKPSIDEILNALYEGIEIEMSDLILDNEVNRLLADLIDQTKKLGLTVEQYLLAKVKTVEELKGDYRKQAQKSLSIEFALSHIADAEKITVSAKDIEDVIAKVEDAKEKEKLVKESYYLAHMIRQQKTLDFLTNL